MLNSGFDKGLDNWSGSHSVGGVDAVTWDGRTTARITDSASDKAYGRESMPGLPGVAGAKPDTVTLNGLHQTDSILAHNGKLYIGVYPSAKIYSYSPGDPWPPALEYTGGQAGNKADDCEPGNGHDRAAHRRGHGRSHR